MTKDEALKLALEALEEITRRNQSDHQAEIAEEAITAIKAALEAKDGECKYCTDGCPACDARKLPEQEPVAWSHAGAMPPEQEEMKEAAYQLAPWLSAALDDPKVCKEYKDVINAWFDAAMPAPQRTWVGLTNEETIAIELGLRIPTGYRDAYDLSLHDFARAIETKLKEKNT